MASHKLGIYWQDDEVEKMLQFLIEKEAGLIVMMSTHLENLSIFKRVAERVEQEGFQRTQNNAGLNINGRRRGSLKV